MKFMMKQSELMKMALDKSTAKRGSDDPVTKGLQREYECLLKAEERRETGVYRENPMSNFD